MKVILAKYSHIASNFTGIVIQEGRNTLVFFKNGKWHNEKGLAFISCTRRGSFWFNNNRYGNYLESATDRKLIKSWKKKVKELNRQQKLKVFK